MPSLDLAPVVADFFTGTYTVTRSATQTYDVAGRLVPGTPSTLQVPACIQPARGRELQRLPEGLRATQVILILSTTQLLDGKAATGTKPDVISYKGEDFEVQETEDWSDLAGFYKALAAKVDL